MSTRTGNEGSFAAGPVIARLDLDEAQRNLTVVLDDGESLVVAADAPEARDLVPGLALSAESRAGLEAAAQRKEIAKLVFRWLERRMRCRADLRQRLLARGHEAPLVDTVLDVFVHQGVVDDRAYAEAWARERIANRGVGRAWLSANLRQQGLDADVVREAIDSAFADCGIDELDAARRALRKRRLDLDDEAQRNRGLRFLRGRGFDGNTALRAVRAERAGDEDDLGAHA